MSTNLSEQNQEILTDIQNLQGIEQEIFNNLESNSSTMTDDEQNQLIQKISEISQMRINLYKSLSVMNNFYKGSLVNSRDTLDEQVVAIGVIEDQLNDAKKRLALIEEEKNNNIRKIEINDYYSNKYNSHSNIMKIIIYMLIPIIILALLYNNGILPKVIYLILVVIISIIGFYFLFTSFFYNTIRDNMNYQEFNWDFNQKNAPVLGTNSTSDVDPWSGGVTTVCVGAQCCNQYESYDVSLNKCISITNNSSNINSTSGTDLNAPVSNVLNSINQGISNVGQGISNDYNSFSSYVSNNF